jgi:hypothetical protein
MRLILIIGLSLSSLISAQGVITAVAGGLGAGSLPRFELKMEPPNPPFPQRFGSGFSASTNGNLNGGSIIAHRYLRDDSAHVFLGYDLLIEPQPQADTYRLSFWELGLGPLDMGRGPRNQPFNPADWRRLPIPGYPAPQVVHMGDTISIDLMVDAGTGQKLVDYVGIQQRQPPPIPPRLPSPIARPVPTVPTVSGVARDFSAEDAEMRILQPRITMNGTPQDTTPSRGAANATGTLVWFHLPNHGRYILSLAPRADLGFVKAGEVRGGAITFTLGDDKFTLESNTPITTGYAPYILYVLHDPDWEPTAQAQRGHFQTGSVSPGEIALLRRK